MEIWKETQLRKLAVESNVETAYRIALNFFNSMGYEYYAFSTTAHLAGQRFDSVNLNNYPHDWNTEYEKNHYSSIDPIVAHCHHSILPIVWDSKTFAKAPALWHALEEQGLQHGWSQPARDPNGQSVSMLSMARSHCQISAFELYEHLGYAVFISHALHSLAMQRLCNQHPQCVNVTHLSPREIEVLRWSADGKTASDIATILNLSERTVNFHVSSSIRKLGVSNKISAVVKAARSRMI